MLHFTLPRTYLYTFEHLTFLAEPILGKNDKICSEETLNLCSNELFSISTSLAIYLNNIKERIDEYNEEWETYKKYTNPYEFIHTNIPSKKKNISKYKPLSRSYYKMVELLTFLSEEYQEVRDSSEQSVDENEFCGNEVEAKDPFTVAGEKKLNINLSTKSAVNWCSSTLRPDESLNFSTLHFSPQVTKNGYSSTLRTNKFLNFSKLHSEKFIFGYGDASTKNVNYPIKTFHLAEGPGGFIEAILKMRNNPFDKYIGMTLIDQNDLNVPSWKKSGNFMREHCNNVFIETGADKTGNILSLQNFVYCKEKYKSSMDFITADGGFDFSNDFKNQENSIISLLFAQIAYALCMQKQNGTFILKIFDCFMLHTIDLLYLLSSFYKTVYICKPQTSRYANSEKYVVCVGFIHGSCVNFYPYLYNCFKNLMLSFSFISTSFSKNSFSPTLCLDDIPSQATENGSSYTLLSEESFKYINKNIKISRFLNIPITNLFITKLEEYNSSFGQQQIENIHNTLNLIETKYKNEKMNNLLKVNIQKSIQWCIKHKIPYNVY